MEKSFEIKGSIPLDKAPTAAIRSTLYTPICKAVATLSINEVLEVKVKNRSTVCSISNALKRAFKHKKYKVSQHQTNNGLFCYIREV